MNILVCVKAVPDDTKVKLDPKTNTLIRTGVRNIINPFDIYALDLALRLREQAGGTVTVLSMGIPAAADLLKEALALGADEAILLTDRALAGADSLATSYTLAHGVKQCADIDLVLCGKQSTDGDTAQVGPGLAEELGWPHATYVSKLTSSDNSSLIGERKTTDGLKILKITTPAVLTVVKGENIPKLPSLAKYLSSRDKEVKLFDAPALGVEQSRIGLNGSPTQVVRVYVPKGNTDLEMLNGKPDEQAQRLIERLQRNGFLDQTEVQ